MIVHRARDQKLIKRYSYSQHLCYDCSTIEGESELSTSSSTLDTRIPVSLEPCWGINQLVSLLVPLHWYHVVRPHSRTALYTEWISAQPPCTETAQKSFKPSTNK